MPLSGLVSFNNTGQSLGLQALATNLEGVLPTNAIANDTAATSQKRPMNNCIWILSSDDIAQSIAKTGAEEGSPKYTWKARVLHSTRNDYFWYTNTINVLSDNQDPGEDINYGVPITAKTQNK